MTYPRIFMLAASLVACGRNTFDATQTTSTIGSTSSTDTSSTGSSSEAASAGPVRRALGAHRGCSEMSFRTCSSSGGTATEAAVWQAVAGTPARLAELYERAVERADAGFSVALDAVQAIRAQVIDVAAVVIDPAGRAMAQLARGEHCPQLGVASPVAAFREHIAAQGGKAGGECGIRDHAPGIVAGPVAEIADATGYARWIDLQPPAQSLRLA